MTDDRKQEKGQGGSAGAMPGADFLGSVRQFWEGMPKFPMDMAQNISTVGNTKVLEETATIANRMFEFGQARVQSDMNHMAELAQCKTPEDFMNLQKQWYETALKDFQENNAERGKAGMQLFSDDTQAAKKPKAGK